MRSECSVFAEYADNTACKSNYNMLHFFYVTQDIMSVSEREQAMLAHRERRMAIMIAAKAASSTEGANHDIMSAREPEGACSLLTNGEIME